MNLEAKRRLIIHLKELESELHEASAGRVFKREIRDEFVGQIEQMLYKVADAVCDLEMPRSEFSRLSESDQNDRLEVYENLYKETSEELKKIAEQNDESILWQGAKTKRKGAIANLAAKREKRQKLVEKYREENFPREWGDEG